MAQTNGAATTKAATTNGSSSSYKKDKEDWSAGIGVLPGRAVLGPLFLMFSTPVFSIVFFHVCTHMDGNFVAFGKLVMEKGFFATLYSIWPTPWDPETWKLIGSFALFELLLMRVVPGKRFVATTTSTGHRPVYKANGTACYLITLSTLLCLAYTGTFDPAVIYDKFGNILSSMNVFALVLCLLLLIKGHVAPSTADSGSNGSWIIDYYWGMELYPRILGWDVKVFTNCRMGMMFWAVGIVSYCFKNAQLNDGMVQYGMLASVAIQLVYVTKFFHWEMGYMCSMDIQHDRAGYYICWGCLVWVPAVYTSAAFYLTKHAPDLPLAAAVAIFVAGVTCVWINYDSDRQRYIFRQSNGNCKIWGKTPNKIVAKYQTKDGDIKTSLLLVDGWWKVSRHFHYVPEIMAAFFWSVSALNTGLVGPYFYVTFLTILLTDRSFRDDDRCQSKYGKYWTEYCNQVPWKIVPGIV